ncbi:hypothetical protein BJX70DRAFT_151741 [Aspergillus crustosus]
MAPFALGMRQNSDGAVECWDDDDDLQCYEDIHLRAASSATSVTNSSVRRSGHRDSISSRLSARSDLDSTAGGDEDWQIQLLDDDELVNQEAITSVKKAGIPLPANIPSSALLGGTIRRLGRNKTKREFIDDWSDDLILPNTNVTLELKQFHETSLPEALLQFRSSSASPVKAFPSTLNENTARQLTAYKISDGLSDSFNANITRGVPTLKATKQSSSQIPSVICDSKPKKDAILADDFENDFELPTDDFLRLCHPSARISSPATDELDVEWCEGSIGVRFGGTARDHRSNPSSSISVISPSASSYLTCESDDEGLDGLMIPEGPLELNEQLKGPKNQSNSEAYHIGSGDKAQAPSYSDDFFSGLEITSSELLNPKRPSVNPNVKHKTEPLGSPTRRSATTLTFTNAALSPKTRIPRLAGHDRPHSTNLETVSESGAPLSKFRTSPRRPGHVSHSSVSSLPISESTTIPSLSFKSTRRLAGTRIAKDTNLRGDRGAGKQLLKTKRSMPSMRSAAQPALSTSLPSPPRQNGSIWLSTRLWNPVDRTGIDGKPAAHKSQAPFLPAGASEKQSHHASIKSYRYTRRTSSDGFGNSNTSQGTAIRLPRSSRHDVSSSNETVMDALNTTPKRTLTRPARRRNYGDGTELTSFDDLPTSTIAESKYVKQPSGRGVPRSLRNKLSINQPSPPKLEAPTQQVSTISTPAQQQASIPRFARDTNASRNAREQRIASMSVIPKLRENHPLTPLNSNWKTQSVSRVPSTTGSIKCRKGKSSSISGYKPHLIKPIGAGVQESKSVNGMHYNPVSFRWEGNENIVHGFDTTAPRSPKSSPALITNVGAMQNVQIVGGMVFDPQRMCWLKLAPAQPGVNGAVAFEEEDDVFSNLADLVEPSIPGKRVPGPLDDLGPTVSGDDRSNEESSDEWPITEEFDVGPEFIRRQHTEEEKWRRKVDRWMNHNHADFGSNWRWAIRDLVKFNSTLGAQGLHNA